MSQGKSINKIFYIACNYTISISMLQNMFKIVNAYYIWSL